MKYRFLLIFLFLATFSMAQAHSELTANDAAKQDQLPQSLYISLSVTPPDKALLVRAAMEDQLSGIGISLASDSKKADAKVSVEVKLKKHSADPKMAKEHSKWPVASKILVGAIDYYTPELQANYDSPMGEYRSANFTANFPPMQGMFLTEDETFRAAGDNAGRQLRSILRRGKGSVKDVYVQPFGKDVYLESIREKLKAKLAGAGFHIATEPAQADARVQIVANASKDGDKYDIVYMYDLNFMRLGQTSQTVGSGELKEDPEAASIEIVDSIFKSIDRN